MPKKLLAKFYRQTDKDTLKEAVTGVASSFISISGASKFLGVSPDTLRNWESEGKIQSIRTKGGARRFLLDDLKRVKKQLNLSASPQKGLLPISKASEILNVSADTLRNWDKKGLVKAYRSKGGNRRFTKSEINRLQQELDIPQKASESVAIEPDPFFKTAIKSNYYWLKVLSIITFLLLFVILAIVINPNSRINKKYQTGSNIEEQVYGLATSVENLQNYLFNGEYKKIPGELKTKTINNLVSNVLGTAIASKSATYLQINSDVEVAKNLGVDGEGIFTGNITAPNVIYGLVAGDNITITEGQTPTISAEATVYTAGTDISVSGQQISNTSTLSTVRGRGGCSSCITDDDVANSLTISSDGTINAEALKSGTLPTGRVAGSYTGITGLGTISTGVWNGTKIATTYGGTGLTGYTTGDILYASATDTLAKLPVGTAGQVLVVASGIPSWSTVAASGITADSLDFSEFKDSMTLDASTDIATAGFTLSISGTGAVNFANTGAFSVAGIATFTSNVNANGGFDVDDVFVIADGGAVTANTDIDLVFAGTENMTITNTTNTLGASGMLDLASTSSTTDTRTLDLSTTFSSTGATTSYGLYNAWASSAVVTGASVSQTAYGSYTTATKTGADDATGTYTLYGTYSTASNTGRTAAGTVNTYGGYFTAAGDAAGTSAAIGLYASASGADNNYAAIFENGNVGIGTTTPTGGTLHVVGQCVTGDTKLRRRRRRKNSKGQWEDYFEDVDIKDIKEGDEILSLNETRGEFEPHKVKGLMNMGVQEVFLLTTQSNLRIETTANHPYLKINKDIINKAVRQKEAQFELDQSIRIEENDDTILGLANKESSFTVVLKSKDKKALKNIFAKANKDKLFAPVVFAQAVVTLIQASQFKISSLTVDIEYPGYERDINEIIRSVFPNIHISYKSIGHQKSKAHQAVYGVYLGKRKANETLVVRKEVLEQKEKTGVSSLLKGNLTAELLHPKTSLTIRSPHGLFVSKKYHKVLPLSSQASWTKVAYLKPGMIIATIRGWEIISGIYPTGRKQTYDIEVENTHNFVGNDIVAHNTYINSSTATGIALDVDANSLSTGTGLNVSSTSTAGGASGASYLLYLDRSGANTNTAHSAYGVYSTVTNTNATSGTNIAGYFSASGATTANYGLIVAAGNVGIGDTTPSAPLEVGNGTDSIQFSSVGDITFVDADGAASVTGPAGGALTVAAGSSQALTLTANNASTWSTSNGLLTITGDDGLTLTASTTAGVTVNTVDNITNALDIQQGTDNYINVNTTNTSENISFGNATTNPSYSFLGTGAVTIAGSADGTDALILTNGDILVSNGDLDLSGGDFNVNLDDGDTVNIDGDTSPTADIVKIGNGDTTASAIDGLEIVLTTSEGASGTNLLNLTPTFASTTNNSTHYAMNIANITATSTTNNLIARGINIGNMTEAGTGTVASSAIRIGTGWDDILNYNGTTVINGTGQVVSTQITGTLFSNSSDSNSGTNTIVQGDTLTISGGTNGIDTSLSNDTYTLNLDTTEIGTTTFGSGSGITWTADASAGTDPTIAFGDGTVNITATTTTATGALSVTGNTTLGDLNTADTLTGNLLTSSITSGATTQDVFTITSSSLSTGTSLTLVGPTSTGVTDHFVKVSSDIGSGASLLNLNPDFSGAGVTGYGIYNSATDSTSSTNTDYGYNGSLSLTGNAAKTGYGIYSTVTSSSTTADTIVAADLATTHTGNISSGTKSVYGLRSQPSSAGATDTGGTINTYGGYFDATGATGGTSSAYGVYIADVSGADTNVGLCFDCDGTWTSSTVASGIQFGSDANAVNLYRNGSDLLQTDDAFTATGTLTASSTFAANAASTFTPSGTNDVTFTTDSDSTVVITGLSSASGTALCVDASNNVVTCGAGSGSGTLQADYNNDTDGSDTIIALTTADDSLIFRNPASGGTDSAFVLQLDNLETGNTDANFKILNITGTGSFNTTSASLTNYSGYFSNTSSESAGANTLTNVGIYATASGGDANYAAIFESGNVGIGDTTPDALFDIDSSATTTNISGITSTALTSGKAFDITATGNGYTTGNLINASLTQSAATGTSVSGDIASVSFAPTYSTAVTTPTISGNVLDVSRTTTTNSLFASTLTVSGALVSIADNSTQTTGTLTHTANVLFLDQNYGSSTGAVLSIENAGTGSGIALTSSSTGVLATLDASGSGTSADGLLIRQTSSGTITDAIDVSDETITNAINVGANTILGTTAAIDFSEFDVSGTTGSITINDDGDAGNISIESTVLDINSLDFVGAGTLTSGATANLTFTPGTTGDLVFSTDADTTATFNGSAEGTANVTLTAGDLTITDGDLNISSGEIAATSDDATGTNFSFTTGALSTGTGLGVVSTSNALTSGGLTSASLTSSSATASFTGDISSLSTSRTNATASQTLTDSGNILDLARTTITNNGTATTNVTGPILNITNTATQTLGTLSDSAALVKVTQDADATGSLLHLVSNRSSTNTALLIEQTDGGTDILSLTDAGNLAINGDLAITGGNITTAITADSTLTVTGTFSANGASAFSPTSTSDVTFTTDSDSTVIVTGLSTATGTGLCLDGTNNLVLCGTGSSSATLQSSYDSGNTITTTNSRNIAITLADTTTDSKLTVTTATGSTGGTEFILADGAGTTPPTQLVLIDAQDTNLTLGNGILVQAATGGVITDAIDASDAEIVNAINVGANTIEGAGFAINSTAGNLTLQTTTSGNVAIVPAGTGDLAITTDSDSTINITGLASGSGTALCVDGSSNVVTCATGSGSTTLQSAYDTDADGSDTIIALSTTDDSIIFRNPATSGTDSAFTFQVDNIATGMTTANYKNLNVTSTGTLNTTSASLTNYSGYFSNTSTESAGANTLTNVGLYATASGADANYAAIFDAGNVGIGDTTPSSKLEIGDGTDSIQFSSVGDITFVDADGAASITGPAGGALTVAAGASQALTLTGNGNSTWSTSNGTLTVTGDDGLTLTASTTAGISGNFPDNITNALDIQQGTDNYINVNTTNTSENISFGNATTNPSYSFLGTGGVTIAGSAEGTASLTQTAGDHVITDGDLTLSGGEITATSDDATGTNFSFTTGALTTGTGLGVASTSNAYTTGSILTASLTQSAATGTSVSGDIASVSFAPTYSTAVTTPAISGNVLDISRTSTTNSSFASTLTVSGAVVSIADNSTQTTGTLTHSANVLFIDQNYGSSTGDVLALENAGTGDGIQLTASSTGVLINLIASGSGTTADGIIIANTSSGAITDAIDVSDAEIVNGINLGANFALFSTIRAAELADGTLTIEDTSGNDLMTIADGGTTGNATITGTLNVNGNTTLGDSNTADTLTGTLLTSVFTSGATTQTVFSIASTSLTTGEILDITSTSAPTDGSTNEAIDINITHSPTTNADTFQGIFTTTTDATTLDSDITGLRSDLTLTGNAAKVGRAVFGNVTSNSTTADTLYGGRFSTTASGNAARSLNIGTYTSANSSSTTADAVYGIYSDTSATGVLTTGTRNNYGIRSLPASTAASTGGTLNLYGGRFEPSSTLSNPGVTDTTNNNVYGVYTGTTATIASDCTTNCTTNQYGVYIANGSSSTNGTSTKYGLYVESPTGADTNYAAIFAGGNVGIGTPTPTGGTLHVVGQCVAAGTRIRRRRRLNRHSRAGGNPPNKDDKEGWIEEEVPVEEIKSGDEILSLNDKTGEWEWHRVEKTMGMGIQEVFGLKTSSGKYIKTTSNHPYLVQTSAPQVISGAFEVDISGRIEELNKDSFIALANKDYSFTIKLPAKEKRVLKAVHQERKTYPKFGFQVYAHLIIQLIFFSGFKVIELKIDHDYAGSEKDIRSIISSIFPNLLVTFISVGKGSPADRAASLAHKGVNIGKTLTWKEYLDNRGKKKEAQVALKGTADGTDQQGCLPAFPSHRASKNIYHNPANLSIQESHQWIKVAEIKLGMKIATADGWEYVTEKSALGKEQTYDLQIEGTHNFVGNDIVAHNTYISSATATGIALDIDANSLSSGSGLDISSTSTAAASNTQKGLNIALSGTNSTSAQTTYGAYISNTHAGTTSTNVGLYATATGGTTANYAAIFEAGSVGIGTTTPAKDLDINLSGAAASARIKSTNAGVSLTLDRQATTNNNTLAFRTADSTTGEFDFGEFGAQRLAIRGAASPNTEYFSVTNTGLVGIGTTAPDAALEINHATGDSLRLTYNDSNGSATNYTDFSLDSTGALTLTGSNATLADGASAEKTYLTLTPGTTTLTGPTQVTSVMDTSIITGATIAASVATTVNDASALTLTAPVDSTNTTLTRSQALRINDTTSGAGTLTSLIGLYIAPQTGGATNNYGICFDCDGTWTSSTVASGIQFGSDANAVTLYRSASDTLKTDDSLVVGVDLTVSGGDITGTGDESIDIGEATTNGITFLIDATAETLLTSTAFSPSTSDGNALGTTSLMWSDLFLASGGVINFNNGDVTLTHSTDTLTLAGGNLAIGTNSITGTSAAIDFSEFDVSGTTGSITINDDGDAGNINIESTVLDINSLDFVAGGTITAGGSGDLALNAAGDDLTISDRITHSPPATSGTPSTTGSWFAQGAQTFTDNNTAGSGTAASMVFNSFATPTLAASNTSVTTTQASTLYIANSPTAGTNQTITNPYSMWVDAGDVKFEGRFFLTNTSSPAGVSTVTSDIQMYADKTVTSDPTGTLRGYQLEYANNPTLSNAANFISLFTRARTASAEDQNLTSATALIGLEADATHQGTTGSTVTGALGVYGRVQLNNAGTITNAYGIRGDNLNTGTGTITTSYALYADNPTNSGGGTIGTSYGLYIEDQTIGGTNDYGIAIEGADTYALWISSAADNTDAANGITFGLSGDTNLYRSAANTLKTDDALVVAGLANLDGGIAVDTSNFTVSGTTGVVAIGAQSGATSTSLTIGALSGATANTAISIGATSGTGTGTGIGIGAISSTGATNTGINIGNISGATSNNYGILLGTLTGGTGSSVYGIKSGTLTSVASGTNYQLDLGAVAGATSATFGAINTGALSGAGTVSYGINLGANSSTATTNYGVNIGAISGAGTTNYGVYVGAVSGSTSNYSAYLDGGSAVIDADNTEALLVRKNGDPTDGDVLTVDTTNKVVRVGESFTNASTGTSLVTYADTTVKGKIDIESLTNIKDVFVYDTAKDSDGGKWRNDERAKASSWYNETIDNTGAACVIGTNDRCGRKEFPEKAIIITTGDSTGSKIHIFDAKDNTLWMSFNPASTNMLRSGVSAATGSLSLFALNGHLYFGTTPSPCCNYGFFSVDFTKDSAYEYGTAGTFTGPYKSTIANRNGAKGWFTGGTTFISDFSVNDVHASVINGKTFIAIANDTAVSVLNETDQVAYDYSDATGNDYNQAWLDQEGNLWALNEALAQLEKWNKVVNDSADELNGTPDSVWDEASTPALTTSAPTIQTTHANLVVTNGTSKVDGNSPTVYVGTNLGLSVLQTKAGDETNGSVKYYTKDYITEEMVGDIRGMWPMFETASLTTSGTDIADRSVKANNLMTNAITTNNITSATGAVRGTGLTLDGTDDYLCMDTALADTTCDDDADLDFAAADNFTIGAWFKHATIATTADYLITKGTSSTSTYYKVYMDASGDMCFDIHDGTNTDTACTSAIDYDDNVWHYVTAVKTGTTKIELYIDGELVASDSTIAATGTLANTGALNVGADATPDATTVWAGSVDEVFVTAEALSKIQIKQIYRTGLRASQNHTASRITGVTGTDDYQKLLGAGTTGAGVTNTTSVAVDDSSQFILAGTDDTTADDGGVTVIGVDSDSALDLYDDVINTGKDDDAGTQFAGNDIVSISLSGTPCIGYNSGTTACDNKATVAIAGTDDTTTSLWMETSDLSLNTALATLTSPGISKDQIIANNLLQVFNSYANKSGTSGDSAQTAAFQVDQLGQLVLNSSTVTGTAATITNSSTLVNGATATNSNVAGLFVSTADSDTATALIRNSATTITMTNVGTAGAQGDPGVLTVEGNDTTNVTLYNLITAYNSNTRSDAAAVFRVRADGNVYGEAAFNASGADYAEYFYSRDSSLEAGEVVMADAPEASESAIAKSSGSYNQKVVGIISTKPAFIGNNPGGTNENKENYKLVALSGRVPTKVTNENGPVQVGDFLTSSSTPGYAMKATRPGPTVGKALEDFDGVSGKIVIFVNVSYADPGNFLANLTFDEDGSLIVPKLKTASLTIAPVENVTLNPSVTLNASEGYSLESTLLTSGTPAATDDNLQPTNYIEVASKLQTIDETLNQQAQAIASINEQVATQSAQLAEVKDFTKKVGEQNTSLSQSVASTSANLASLSSRIDDLLGSILGQEASSSAMASESILDLTPPDILLATGSAQLADLSVSNQTSTLKLTSSDVVVTDTFKSLGETFLGSTLVAGDLTIDGTFSITEGNTINAFPILYFQTSPLAEAIDFFNGLVSITKAGEVKAQILTAQEFRAETNKTVGSGKISAGNTSVQIESPIVKQTSRILVTPTVTGSQILAVTDKIEATGSAYPGKFTVSSQLAVPFDTTFDWLIINEIQK